MRSRSIVFYLLVFFLVLSYSNTYSQFVVTTSQPAAVLASTLAGPGVTILAPSLTCPAVANGKFTSTGTLLAMTGGIVLTNGHAAACVGPYGAPPGTASFNDGAAGDPAMAPFLPAGTNTYDACILQFDMVASGDSIGFNYQFGSQEYDHSDCGVYTDVFAFFISGPGIVGTPNIALVPGTTIPVEVNSVNSGVVGTSAGANITHCTSLGAGSPFTGYYINNIGGTQLSYTGYTTKFRAVHAVTACDTYHLKLSIVDAGNGIYDSGVFLEAASLTSNSFSFNHADVLGTTVNGVANTIVKGCNPTTATIVASNPAATATTLNLSFGGTAVNGVDVTTIPGTVTLPAGSDSVAINIQALATPVGGTKTLTIYLHGPCSILDSVKVTILDTPSARILTPDTAVCPGATFQILATGTAGLVYNWTPSAGLSSTTILQPIATPTTTTTYILTATLPGSTCPPIVRSFNVGMGSTTIAMITHDTAICLGSTVDIQLSGSAANIYSWTPATGLNNSTLQDPVATPAVTTAYTVTATTANGLCPATATLNITVSSLQADILSDDTTLCSGSSMPILVTGTAGATYSWSPASGLSSSVVMTPTAGPTASTTYTMTASLPGSGCPPIVDSIHIIVTNATIAILTPDTSVCAGQSVRIRVNGSDSLSYSWTPATSLDSPNIKNPLATPTTTTTYFVTSTSSVGCSDTRQISVAIVTINADILTPDTAVCKSGFPLPGVQIRASGDPALTYQWLPTAGIAAPNVLNPLITPDTSATYYLLGSEPGCSGILDSIKIDVQPLPNVYLTTDRTVCQHDTLHIVASVNPQWYTHYTYSWSPAQSLDNSTTSTVVFTPGPSQTLTLTVTTPLGNLCKAVDTTHIIVFHSDSSAIRDTSLCPGDSMQLTPASFVEGSMTAYKWHPGIYLSDSNATNPWIRPITTQSYWAIGTNQYGCLDTITLNVTMSPAAEIYLPDSVTIYPGESYQISPQTNCSSFAWYPPAGLNYPFISNPIATPEVNTKYIVTGTTEWNCKVIDSIVIYVDPETLLALPNAFTPGVGPNSLLKILKRGIATLNYFQIYNRWGNLVYDSNDIDGGWDGTFNGKPQDFDVYVYQLEAVTNKGKVFKKHGNVTLLR